MGNDPATGRHLSSTACKRRSAAAVRVRRCGGVELPLSICGCLFDAGLPILLVRRNPTGGEVAAARGPHRAGGGRIWPGSDNAAISVQVEALWRSVLLAGDAIRAGAAAFLRDAVLRGEPSRIFRVASGGDRGLRLLQERRATRLLGLHEPLVSLLGRLLDVSLFLA